MSIVSDKRLGLVDEARRQYRGEFVDRTQWNNVMVGKSSFTVERAPIVKSKINMEEIKFTYPHDKKPHKMECGLCKLHFARPSMTCKVPNHRIIEKEREWGVYREGRRYQSASFLYAIVTVCKFCSQLFSELDEDFKSKVRTLDQLARL